MAKSGSNWRTIVLVVVLFISFVMFGFGLAIYGNTLTKWWIPVVPALTFAAVTTPLFVKRWRGLTESRSSIYNAACHIFTAFSVAYFLFLGCNYFFADDSTLVVEKTEVVKKYSKTHTRYRRVSRNRRVPDGHYFTYHILLRFSDGREKEQEVKLQSYNRIRTGSTRDVKVENGLFGLAVIKH
ncbi:MAG: hypothetical protein K2H32_02925 [Muribaculaceae bacterium]|nr:hypothetical protein [Muribaculaceae bacterium]MDE5857295.1 hypothetical protein [Muribaculaceae bacterium]MDE7369582.1 hypothetical protein [Muribaculaceae bacterium]